MGLLHALGTFVRVAETGSFSAVARETNNSQSSARTRQDGWKTTSGCGCSTAQHDTSA